MDQSKH